MQNLHRYGSFQEYLKSPFQEEFKANMREPSPAGEGRLETEILSNNG